MDVCDVRLSASLCGVLYIYIMCVSAAGHEHVPSWVWVLAGFFNFLAYTLGESNPPTAALCVVLL